MSKRRILLVVRHPVGGIRTFFRYVYRHFSPGRYEFTLIAPDLPEARLLLDDLRDLELTFIPLHRNVSSSAMFRAVMNTARKGGFDLIHSHGFTSGACSAAAALLTRTPHVLTCHDVFTDQQFTGVRGRIKRMVLGGIFATIDGIHCVSRDARANLLEYLPVLRPFSGKITAILNGIESNQFLNAERRDLRRELELPQDAFIIGFLGRFMSQKGFRYLVEAMEEIRDTPGLPRHVILLCFGEDGFVREEREAVARKGLADSIRFLPFVPNVAATLKGLDMVAMPSLWEACGLLAMETMTAGVPLVGSDCIGLREVLRDTPAYMVPAGNGPAIARTVIAEVGTPTIGTACAFASRAARRFDVKERAVEIEAMMLRIMKH